MTKKSKNLLFGLLPLVLLGLCAGLQEQMQTKAATLEEQFK